MAAKKTAPQPPQPPPRRRDEPPAEEGLPPWMATFADMVTLLLCFFVLLLSFANMDINNFKRLKGSIQEALGMQTVDKTATSAPYAETSAEMRTISPEQKQKVQQLSMDLRDFVTAARMQQQASVSDEEDGVVLRVDSRALFSPGSARLTGAAREVLGRVVDTMRRTQFNLIVRGHTSDDETAGAYGSTWELSATRAAACLRYVIAASGLPASRFKAAGFADSKPLVPNTTPENRALNRRVEFYFQIPGERGW